MKPLVIPSANTRPVSDLLVLPFFQDGSKVQAAFSSFPLDSSVEKALALGDFHGKFGELLLVYPNSKKEKRIVLFGLGEEALCSKEVFRKAGGEIAKFSREKEIKTLTVPFAEPAFAEGIFLGSYVFNALKKEALDPALKPSLKEVRFISKDKELMKTLKHLLVQTNAVNLTRDLVNGNADDVHADKLCQIAKELAKEYPALKVSILRKDLLEKEKMGLMLAVNRASTREPALITIEYCGKKGGGGITAIVGKGVTYDTGGLNLKPTGSMETMKCDMAGAGAVFGAMQAIAELKLDVHVVGVLAVVENAIGPHSFKPGDVYVSRSGKSVEIGNTDAEGRLVLADAVTYVQDVFAPSRIIDLATLTGAVIVALGEEFIGLFSNDDSLAQGLSLSGNRSGDRLWRLPLDPAYSAMLKSKIADLKNMGEGRKASSSVGAAFIEAFIRPPKGKKEGALPWAHLDIAGTAFLDAPKGYHSSQATGSGVRLLLDFLQQEILWMNGL